jgi:DNA-binding FadR family transcriptional regulator
MAAVGASSVLRRVTELQAAVVRRNTRDVVADKLASLIALGILQIGDVLPSERDLAAALQVSRETIRGGTQILAARGIVEISQGARTRVVSADVGPVATGLREPKHINSYDLGAVHAARLLVERRVVAEAATRIEDSVLELLDDCLEAQRSAINAPVHFLISDREFHLAIYKASGNPVLADFVSDLYTYMLAYRREAISRPGAIEKSYEDHVAIVAGLRAHDPDSVVAAFEIHLDRIYTSTQMILNRDPLERLKYRGL